MIIKCSKCNHQKIVDNPLYSSPVFKCDNCGNSFYDNRFKEAALYPRPINIREKQNAFFTYGTSGCGVFLVLLGAILSLLPLVLIGLFILVGVLLIFLISIYEFRQREATYKKILNESNERLRSRKYQELLLSSSNFDETVINLLEKYNQENSIVFLEDSREGTKLNPDNSLEKERGVELDLNKAKKLKNKKANKFCRKCGSNLFEDSLFCHCCGEKIKY